MIIKCGMALIAVEYQQLWSCCEAKCWPLNPANSSHFKALNLRPFLRKASWFSDCRHNDADAAEPHEGKLGNPPWATQQEPQSTALSQLHHFCSHRYGNTEGQSAASAETSKQSMTWFSMTAVGGRGSARPSLRTGHDEHAQSVSTALTVGGHMDGFQSIFGFQWMSLSSMSLRCVNRCAENKPWLKKSVWLGSCDGFNTRWHRLPVCDAIE